MKQLDIFDTDYESCNYTKTSQEALATIKPKIKTKREQVYDLIKLNALTNYEIADELEIPFVASGGMADARSLVAAMALGAEGMNMGTRFIATQDAPVHQNVKEAIVNATELDTRLIMRSLTNTERVLNNEAVERLMEKEKALGDKLRFEDILDEVAGVYPKIMHEGTLEAGAWSCGMVAGLVNDIPTVDELITGIMSEADAIINSRLSNF